MYRHLQTIDSSACRPSARLPKSFIGWLAVVCLVVASTTAAKTVNWNAGDGVWDYTAPSWANGLFFADGDTAVFSGSYSPNRNRTNAVAIDAGGVAPAAISTGAGYGAHFRFTGGDILDFNGTPTTISAFNQNNLDFRSANSYSFSGGIASAGLLYYTPQVASPNQTMQLGSGTITTAGLHFQPAQSGTRMDNVIYLTGGSFFANANADWSATTLYTTGANTINVGTSANNYTNLTFNLQGDTTFALDYRNSNPFTANVVDDYLMTAHVVTGYNGRAVIDGVGNWDIAGLVKTGAGQLDVRAPGVFGDSLNIQAGAVRLLNVDQTIPGRATLANASGAVFNLNSRNLAIGSLSGGGASGGNIALGTATLTVGGDNTSPAPYAGSISGSGGLTKVGDGALTLAGANTYTGTTNILSGMLWVNGTHHNGAGGKVGDYTISSGATLGGSGGEITTDVYVQNGGVLSSGASVGILTINGNVLFEAGSSLLVEMQGDSQAGVDYDLLIVDGDVTFEPGAQLELGYMGGYTPGLVSSWSFLQVSGNTVGYELLALPDKHFLSFDDGILTLTYIPEPASGLLLALAGLCALRRRRG